MEKFTIAQLTLVDLERVVDLREQSGSKHSWTQVDDIILTADELRRLDDIQAKLVGKQVHLLNEATIWSRAIYPLLLVAERDDIQAWAEVPLQATYRQFTLEGIADGVLGKSGIGRVKAHYLVMVETKRGIENANPIFQLYGQLLAAAHINWANDNKDPQEIFGCYTIADSWTFVHAQVAGLDTERPTLDIEVSSEYVEKVEMETILKILKNIVERYSS
jgi:hypothetical protein